MSDELHNQILQQIEMLEEQQRHLKKAVEHSASLDEILASYQPLDVDFQQRFLSNLQAFQTIAPDIAAAFSNYTPQALELKVVDESLAITEIGGNTPLFPGDNVYYGFEKFHRFRFSAVKSTYMLTERIHIRPGQFVHTDYLNQLIETTNECLDAKNFDYKLNQLPGTVNAFISFGVGLGNHLEELLKYHQLMNLHIIEPNPDLFFYSLFVTDWTFVISKLKENNTRVQFTVGTTDVRVAYEELLALFDETGRFHAANCYFYDAYQNDFLKECYSYFDRQLHENLVGVGFFDDANMSIGHQRESLKAGVPVLKNKSQAFKYHKVPVFLVANGPSLDDCFEYIEKYGRNAFIVTCGTAITAFYRKGIVPDLHIELERMKITNTILSAIDDAEYLKQIPLVTVNTVHPSVYEHFKESFMALKGNEAATTLFTLSCNMNNEFAELLHCNPTVMNLGLAVLMKLGFRDIYTMGTDLGFVADKHHSQSSIYYDEKGEDKQHYQKDKSGGIKLFVKGNFAETVQTEPMFNLSRLEAERLLKLYPDHKIKNCSNGVYIEGTSPYAPSDIALENALDKQDLLSHMFKNAVKTIPESSLEQMNEKLHPEQFQIVVDDIIESLSQEFATRKEALVALEKVYLHVQTFVGTRYQHFFEMLNGSTVGFFARLVQLLMVPPSDEQGLAYFEQGNKIYKEFLHAVAERYHSDPYRVDAYWWVGWNMDKPNEDTAEHAAETK